MREQETSTGLGQVAQRAVDLGRATACYTELLDASPLARFDPPGLVSRNLGGTRLLLERGASGVRIGTEPHVIFTHSEPLTVITPHRILHTGHWLRRHDNHSRQVRRPAS